MVVLKAAGMVVSKDLLMAVLMVVWLADLMVSMVSMKAEMKADVLVVWLADLMVSMVSMKAEMMVDVLACLRVLPKVADMADSLVDLMVAEKAD